MKIIFELANESELPALKETLAALKMPTPIGVLGLSPRSHTILICEGVHTVEALARLTDNELLRMPNLGRIAVTEIREALASHPPPA